MDWLKATAPAFAIMRQLAMRFRGIFRGNDPSKLDVWLGDAHHTGLYSTPARDDRPLEGVLAAAPRRLTV